MKEVKQGDVVHMFNREEKARSFIVLDIERLSSDVSINLFLYDINLGSESRHNPQWWHVHDHLGIKWKIEVPELKPNFRYARMALESMTLQLSEYAAEMGSEDETIMQAIDDWYNAIADFMGLSKEE